MNDTPRGVRRRRTARSNLPPKPREELEAEHGEGNVFDTQELARSFIVLGYEAPLVIVRRKHDDAVGSLRVQDAPRLYFGFTVASGGTGDRTITGEQ